MRRLLSAILIGIFVIAPSYIYVYIRGGKDMITHYKHSKQFYMTLESMYRFGVMDGCTDDTVCDKYGLFAPDEGGHR